MAMKFDEIVEKYIELRDRKAQYKADYDAKVKKIDEALEKMEGVILKRFAESGTESVRTSAGTAYKSVRTSATVADWDVSLAFIRENDEWGLLEHRVSKKAVEEYMAAHEVAPPGVSVRSEVTVNVRRS